MKAQVVQASTPAPQVEGREHYPLACDWLSIVRSGVERG
jgi:hypothetical protein